MANTPCLSNTFKYIVRAVLPLAWTLTVAWLSLTSSPPQLPGALGWDKLLHAGAYCLLTILVAQFHFIYTESALKAGWSAAFLVVLFGGLLELLQSVGQAGRTAEWGDLIADTVGAAAGCVLFCLIVKIVFQQRD